MGHKNPKAKGSAYERKVCQRLSLWVSGLKSKDLFWRTAISGGRATQQRKKGEINLTQAGDVCSVSPEGHAFTDLFVVECKHLKDLDLDCFFFASYGATQVHDFWIKLKGECAGCREPMLFAQENGRKEIVMISARGRAILERAGRLNPLVIVPPLDMQVFLVRDLMLLDFSKIRTATTKFLPKRPLTGKQS